MRVALVSHHSDKVLGDVSGVVAGDEGAPAGADSLGPVDEGERDDGEVVVGLYRLAFLLQVVEEGVIVFMEEVSRNWIERGEDVSW